MSVVDGPARLMAFTREPGPSLGHCELTHLRREPIDIALAGTQHEAYERALEACGCEVHRLAPEPELPDAVFVEDTAIVLDELAIMARPGAASRRAEVSSVAVALSRWRRLAAIVAPGTLDGGDVLRLGRTIFVGRSSRTNDAAIDQVRALVADHGYRVEAVGVRGCLHLKSAVCAVASETLLVNRRWIDAGALEGHALIDVHPSEPFAANALLIGDRVIYPASFPRTRALLEQHGVAIEVVDLSETAKAEGGVTCCSLVLRANG